MIVDIYSRWRYFYSLLICYRSHIQGCYSDLEGSMAGVSTKWVCTIHVTIHLIHVCTGTASGIKLYLNELMHQISPNISAQSWEIKRTAARALSTIAEKAGMSLIIMYRKLYVWGIFHVVNNPLCKYWQGKKNFVILLPVNPHTRNILYMHVVQNYLHCVFMTFEQWCFMTFFFRFIIGPTSFSNYTKHTIGWAARKGVEWEGVASQVTAVSLCCLSWCHYWKEGWKPTR